MRDPGGEMSDKAEVETALLLALKDGGEVESLSFASERGFDHDVVVNVVKSLHSTGVDMAAFREVTKVQYSLTEAGRECAERGSPEAQVRDAVPEGESGVPVAEAKAGVAGPVWDEGFKFAMQLKWIRLEKGAEPRVLRAGGTGGGAAEEDPVRDQVKSVAAAVEASTEPALPAKDMDALVKKRKYVQVVKVRSYFVTKGPQWALVRQKPATDLTADILESALAGQVRFKEYNFETLGGQFKVGGLHPLLKVRDDFKSVFLGMGFEEMATNRWVESSFWNFDTLFQPQQHPARDAHDTFFLSRPELCKSLPTNDGYLARVRNMHEYGGAGSIGYRYNWSEDEARKNILRTHTTAVSSRMLNQVAHEIQSSMAPFRTRRFFSVDRVFRNESVDRTHLAEFHQIEGLVIGMGLTLGDLLGTIREFFAKIGLRQLRFKPTFNPYTEPSMEIFCFHPGLGKWVEIGNSGMFRPEMLGPMGIPKDVQCIAWGLSLERPTMILHSINNIRDLFGHKVDLNLIETNPVSRLLSA